MPSISSSSSGDFVEIIVYLLAFAIAAISGIVQSISAKKKAAKELDEEVAEAEIRKAVEAEKAKRSDPAFPVLVPPPPQQQPQSQRQAAPVPPIRPRPPAAAPHSSARVKKIEKRDDQEWMDALYQIQERDAKKAAAKADAKAAAKAAAPGSCAYGAEATYAEISASASTSASTSTSTTGTPWPVSIPEARDGFVWAEILREPVSMR